MAIKNATATNIVFRVDGNIFGCVSSATLNMTKEEIDAACAASGGWSEFTQGRKSWTLDFDALIRLFTDPDAAANFSFNDAFADFVNDVVSDIEFQIGNATDGGVLYTGKGFLTGVSLNTGNDAQTWSGTYRGTGPLVPSTPAA